MQRAHAGASHTPRSAGAPESVAALLLPLQSPDPHVRQAGCTSLVQPALRSDPRVVAALRGRLQDRDQYVRQAAANAVGQLAQPGDEATIDALITRLGDPDYGVRRVAATALGHVAPPGCSSAACALASCLEDRDGGVRRSALKALEKTTVRAEPGVLTALLGKTADGEAFVRHTAAEVLGRLADEGNEGVVSRLLALLEADRDARVRLSAAEALGRLAVRGDRRVLNALCRRLDDDADGVRRAAANALGHVTFAPGQELETQEQYIAKLEHEASLHESTIADLKGQHAEEISQLLQRIDDLEDRLLMEMEERDRHKTTLETRLCDQTRLLRVYDVFPHWDQLAQFLDTLPSVVSTVGYGGEFVAPLWALRRVGGVGPPCAGTGGSLYSCSSSLRRDAPEAGGGDQRWVLRLVELFGELSAGAATPMQLTEAKPLDVYVHCGDDNAWGLYCCSRHRLPALLMHQACARHELLTVRCVLRPKDDGYWGWQWSTFYDGGDGLDVQPKGSAGHKGSDRPASLTPPPSPRLLCGGTHSGPPLALNVSTPRSKPRSCSAGGGLKVAGGLRRGTLAPAGARGRHPGSMGACRGHAVAGSGGRQEKDCGGSTGGAAAAPTPPVVPILKLELVDSGEAAGVRVASGAAH